MPPQSPNPDFDFMLKNQPPVKHGLPLFNFNSRRSIKIALLAAGAIIVLIIIFSALGSGSSGSATAFNDVLARGQETLRVTQLVQQQLQLQNPQTQALAATASNSLTSDQVQIKKYMALNHMKVSSAQIAAETDKSTDASLQTALQNNNLDGAYVSYLQSALTKYEQDLQNAYKLAGLNGKQLLSNAFSGAQAMLSSSPIKS